jgi:hypothetical protein
MSIWSTIVEWCNKPTPSCTVQWIADQNARPALEQVAISADTTYVRVSLVRMVLTQARTWFRDIQPCVQASTSLVFGDHVVDIPKIAAPDKNQFPARAVLENYRLLDLTPFHGNTVELKLALVSVPGDDKLANGIRAVANIASLLSAPLSGALVVADKLRDSADMLVGNGAEIHLAYHNVFTAQPGANQLRCAYLAIVAASADQLGATVPVVLNDELLMWSNNAGAPVPYDHMLLRFEVLANRDDLRNFSDLEQQRELVLKSAASDPPEVSDRVFRTAQSAIMLHPELTNADRRVLMTELKSDRDALVSPGKVGMQAVKRDWDTVVKNLPLGDDHRPITLEEFI